MKNWMLIFCTGLMLASCLNNTDKNAGKGPQPATAGMAANVDTSDFTTIEWVEGNSKNLGKIDEGQNLNISFKFRNTGSKPLVIARVQPSCGCTVADYPKEPVAPGAEAEITGSFDSKGRQGMQHKTITVMANTKGSQLHELKFEVDVNPAPPKNK